jgi:Spy/CpxP family protein refolding chaperone
MNTRSVTQHRRTSFFLPVLLSLTLTGVMLVGLADAANAQRSRARRAQWAKGHAGMPRGLGLEVLAHAEEIGLSEEQVARLKDIRKSVPGKIMPKNQALMEARLEYQDLMSDANADSKALRQAHQRVLDAQAQVKAATFDLRLEVRDVLTPEQRAEVKKMVKKRVRLRRPRTHRLHRGHWGMHGDSDAMLEHFDSFDDHLEFYGFGPGSDEDWNVDGMFWLEKETDDSSEKL